MGRYRAVAALLCGVAACATGCVAPGGGAPDGGAPEVQEPAAAEAAPPAFHFDSGDLVIGSFDPEQVKDNLFDPCAEISDAELAAAGLEKDPVQGDHSELDARYIKACGIKTEDPHVTVGLITNAISREMVESRSAAPNSPYSTVPGAFQFSDPDNVINICDTAVETDRGTFSVTVSNIRSSVRKEELCARSAQVMDQLFAATM